jgi:hypothetical protein
MQVGNRLALDEHAAGHRVVTSSERPHLDLSAELEEQLVHATALLSKTSTVMAGSIATSVV